MERVSLPFFVRETQSLVTGSGSSQEIFVDVSSVDSGKDISPEFTLNLRKYSSGSVSVEFTTHSSAETEESSMKIGNIVLH